MRPLPAIGAVFVLTVLTACSSPVPSGLPAPSLAAGEVALPEAASEVGGVPAACAGVGFVGPVSLHGSPDDPAVTWIDFEITGERKAVEWPHGYRARFSPRLEVLDETGRVIAREGDLAQGGCPMPPGGMLIELAPPGPDEATLRPTVSVSCGRIKVTDCHDSIFLVASIDQVPVNAATSIVVDDLCPPTVLCDRRYPFMAIVVLVTGSTVTGTFLAVGQTGPDDHAEVWHGALPAHIVAQLP